MDGGNTMKIALMQISDMHFVKEQFLDYNKITKIAVSLREFGHVDKLLLFLVGDLAFSGKKEEYETVSKFVNKLMNYLKIYKVFFERINIFCIPGNHDLDQTSNILSIDELNSIYKNNKYEEYINTEFIKLSNFFDYAELDRCFIDNKMLDTKHICFGDYSIDINLLNTAVFSNIDSEEKGLHYFRDDDINKMKNSKANLTIFVMHHSFECFTDEVKRKIQNVVLDNANICMSAHEHNGDCKGMIKEERKVIFQTSGAICDNKDWSKSSYIIDLIDTNSNTCVVKNFLWNEKDNIYHSVMSKYELSDKNKYKYEVNNKYFDDLLQNDFYSNKHDFVDGFVFPRLSRQGEYSESDSVISDYDKFIEYINEKRRIVIAGNNLTGKSALLKSIFIKLLEEKAVIYCETKTINEKKIENVIEQSYYEIYGKESSYEKFEQMSVDEKAIIIDDADKINDKKFGKLFNYLSNYFSIIIISSNSNIDFDIVERIKDEADVNDVYSKLNILPFYEDKRLELINKILKIKKVEDCEINTKMLNEWLKIQRKHVPFTAPFIIDFVNYYCNHKDDISKSDSSIFSKVFESNITSNISKCISSDITTEKMYALFSEFAYYSHRNKLNILSEKDIMTVIDEYNNYHGDELSYKQILEISEKSKILISDKNRNGYKFSSSSFHSYFVARKINQKFKKDKSYEDIQYIIENACQSINEEILMFLTYITDDTNILEFIYSMIIALTNEWEELDLDNLPEYMKNGIDYDFIPKLETKDTIIEKTIENEKENLDIKITGMYDYVESDAEKEMNKIICITSLLETIAKALPSFEHLMSKDLKEKYTNAIYTIPNKIFNHWMNIVNQSYSIILNEYFEQKGSIEYLSEKRKNFDEINEYIKNTSLSLLLEIYDLIFSRASKVNTFKYLDEFDYNKKETYMLEHLMFLDKENKFDAFTNDAIRYNNEKFKTYIPKNLTLRIVYHALPKFEKSNRNRTKLISEFVNDRNAKIVKKDVLARQLEHKKK